MKKKTSSINPLEKMSVADVEKRAILLKRKYKNVFDRLAKL